MPKKDKEHHIPGLGKAGVDTSVCTAQVTTSGLLSANICPFCTLQYSSLRYREFIATSFDQFIYNPKKNEVTVTGNALLGDIPYQYIVTFKPKDHDITFTAIRGEERRKFSVRQSITITPCSV
ncbi:hypothetical protein ACFFJY_14845 [Fictibacillus aquaticus]|uniref:Uncharacterized protein n=1 Tax=Fictibacillus aquaticus TaxID=2021314 RepID=A0A235FE63_9BACL|nr:hypothetical protein [Fictibacillus aquaticus]OYD59489.1 hypothetical protein CGZ90_06255 [Fictibacillus aquaticus]